MSRTNDQRDARTLQAANPGMSYQQALARVRSTRPARGSQWRYQSVLPPDFQSTGLNYVRPEDENALWLREFPSRFTRTKDGSIEAELWDPRVALSSGPEGLLFSVKQRSLVSVSPAKQRLITNLLQEVITAGPRKEWAFNDTCINPDDSQCDEDGEPLPYRTGLLDEYAETAWNWIEECEIDESTGLVEKADSALMLRAQAEASAGVYLGEMALPPHFDGLLDYGVLDNRPFWRCLEALKTTYRLLGDGPRANAVSRNTLFLDPLCGISAFL